MHFKLDENIPVQLASNINAQGHSASTVFSEKISGIKDIALLQLCQEQDYALVTLDNDFASVYAFKHGIIVIRTASQGAKSVVEAFENLVKNFDLNELRNKVVIVDNQHIRVRTLP